jgi:D-alanyl-D-alanine carboxypeptidase (penicillin-binding protein 5/6)
LKGILFVAAALAFAAPVLAAPPQVTGRAYVVENGTTGELLASQDASERVPIASITKLMTVLLTVERTRPSDVVTVSARAADVGESSANLRAGERLTVRELLEAALIQSANDAADAPADYVGKAARSTSSR